MKYLLSLWFLFQTTILLGGDFAYVANFSGNNISIIDLATNTAVGYVNNNGFDLTHPVDIIFTPDQSKAYVVCDAVSSVYVIDPAQNLVIKKVDDLAFPFSAPSTIDITLTGSKAYVTNEGSNQVSIIDVASDTVTGFVNFGAFAFNLPFDVRISPNSAKAYVTNFSGNTVSVIDVATDTVTQFVNVGLFPFHQPLYIDFVDNTKVYISNFNATSAESVNIIDFASDTVTGYVNPAAFPFSISEQILVNNALTTAYIESHATGLISIVDIATDTSTGYINAVFSDPQEMHLTINDQTLYVLNGASNSISIINTLSNTQVGVVDSSAYPLNFPFTFDVAFTIVPGPQSPTRVQGFNLRNKFASQTDLISKITWAPPIMSSGVVYYNIYRDAALTNLAGAVSANSALEFLDHNREKGQTYHYFVVAVDGSGLKSSPMETTVFW